ncbi:MAG: YnbE family lipoprotein [Gammaproteobacteria bacterium]|jgi:predicted component of type VI protein secretion system
MKPAFIPLFAVLGLLLTGCSPTVKVEPPDKPITINLNVKVEHEIRVRVERDLEELITTEKGIF